MADFGIACLANAGQTLTQEALGSVHYISPEQARGDRIDARSDIYSAGVVLYEMLTGRLPFEGDTAVSVAIQHLSSVPLAPSEIREDVPKGLELICMKAMCADINKRYASATAMLEDLESFRKNVAEKGGNELTRERARLNNALEAKKQEIKNYETNLSFFSVKSKGANALVGEVSKKIERLKEDLKLIEEKIKAVNEKIKAEK